MGRAKCPRLWTPQTPVREMCGGLTQGAVYSTATQRDATRAQRVGQPVASRPALE